MSSTTPRYGVGGSDPEKSREERWGVVRDIPSDFQTATWVFPRFYEAVFKDMTPARSRGPGFDSCPSRYLTATSGASARRASGASLLLKTK